MITERTEKTAAACAVIILRLDGLPAPESVLSPEELKKYNSFKVEKRRREWLGGRTAAKTLLAESFLNRASPRDIFIGSDSSGRPACFFSGAPALSISHCGEYAAAAADYGHVGIDIEKIEPRARCWVEDSFRPEEAGDASPESLTALWTRKESVLKALGLGLKCSALDVKVSGSTPEFSGTALARWRELGSPDMGIVTENKPDGYILSLSFTIGGSKNE